MRSARKPVPDVVAPLPDGAARLVPHAGSIAPIFLIALTGGLTALIVAAPLMVYSVTLATFGAAHVLSELRYVDRRFGRRLPVRQIVLMALFLAGAVAARASGLFGLVDPAKALMLELSCVVALALSAAAGGVAQRALALAIAGGLGLATAFAPFDTAVSLSILHNLTPLALIWEITPAPARRRVMPLALLAFLVLPLLVASGLPRLALQAAGLSGPGLDPIGAGTLEDHLYVYVPRPLLGGASAVDLFSASVVAQCAHYAAVILVLPMLLARRDPQARGLVPWPRGGVFALMVAGVSAFVLYRFTTGFVPARALYGLAASVHAWIEIPLIIIALTARSQATISMPSAPEATLAASDTAKACRAASPPAHPMMAASTTTTTASAASTTAT